MAESFLELAPLLTDLTLAPLERDLELDDRDTDVENPREMELVIDG